MSSVHNGSGTTELPYYRSRQGREPQPASLGILPMRRALAVVIDGLIRRDGRTQLAISHASHIDQAWLSRIRHGKEKYPTRQMLNSLADGLGLGDYDRAKLLVTAGFLPVLDDPVFTETVCQLAARRGLTKYRESDTL